MLFRNLHFCVKSLIYLMFLMLVSTLAVGQDHLHRAVSVSFENEPINQALIKLSDASDAQLAFNPDILPEKRVTKTYENDELNVILNDLLGKNFQYKIRGSYVIIQPQEIKETKASVQIKGEVRDAETGEELADVSIYEVNRLTATLTSGDGSYDLTSESFGNMTFFMVSKENYRDTLIAVDKSKGNFFDLLLEPLRNHKQKEPVKVDSLKITRFLLKDKIKKHMQNVDLQEHRWVQLSLFPPIGTNSLFSGQVSNNLSINMIGGYVYGVRGVELGGLFNLDRQYMHGFQAGGALNVVGAEVSGAQLSGAVNLVLDSVRGVQMAGAVNLVKGTMSGVQLSGAYNQTGDFKGLQMAGAFNYARRFTGMQMSGAVNIASEASAFQMAGAFNRSGAFSGMQMSGAINFSRDMRGLQMAGAYNQALGAVKGVQISGAVNYATRLRGVQIGVVNIAKEVESGAMIGLVNISKNGLIAVEADYNDVTDYNLSFRSGPRKLHTVLTVGVSPQKDIWSYGMGLGSQFSLSDRLFTGLELSSHTLMDLDEKLSEFPVDNRFNLSIGYSFTNRIAIHGGPVLHFLYYNPKTDTNLRLVNEIGQNPLLEETTDGALHKLWIGYRVAVRL